LERLSTREKVLLIILILAASAFILTKFFLGPQLNAYAAVRDDLKTAKLQVARSLKEVKAKKQEEEKLYAAESRYRELRPYFITDMQDGAALVKLALEAQKEGVAITLFQPKPVVERKYYLELPVEFGVRGDYRHVINYLARVEDKKDLINLSEIRLLTMQPWSSSAGGENGGSGDENSGMVKVRFTLVIYAEYTPEEKIKLEEMAAWAVGRYNSFREAGFVKPYPGVAPVGSVATPADFPPGKLPDSKTSASDTGKAYYNGNRDIANNETNESLPDNIPYVMK